MHVMRPHSLAALLLVMSAAACSPEASGPSEPPPSDPTPTPQQDDQAAFYDEAVVQDVALEVAKPDLDAMLAALPEQIEVDATMTWRDISVPHVSLRFKGNSSTQPGDWKRGFLVDTDTFVDVQRFLGLEHIAFDNGIQFGGLYSEVLVNHILRAEGVPATRANHARLTLNGEPLGVFVNVERIDKKFLKKHFDDEDGNLYKCDEGGPGADLADQGDDPAAYGVAFEAKTNEDIADFSDIGALARMLRDEPDATFAATIEARLDLDAFLTTMGVLAIVGAFDQYTGFQPHNYYLYFNPSSSRVTYLAHDLDVAFADKAFGTIPVIDGWNIGWPVPRAPRPLIERILADAGLRARYQKEARRLLDGSCAPEVLIAALDEIFARIGGDLATDPSHGKRVTVPDDVDAAGVVASMKAFIEARSASAKGELDAPPTSQPPPVFLDAPPGEGPAPGDLVEGAPSGLIATVEGGAVHLSWTAGKGAAASIVQRCVGAGCENFGNIIGLPIDQGASAVDSQVAPATSYRYRVYSMVPTPGGVKGSVPTPPVDVSVP